MFNMFKKNVKTGWRAQCPSCGTFVDFDNPGVMKWAGGNWVIYKCQSCQATTAIPIKKIKRIKHVEVLKVQPKKTEDGAN